MIIIKFKNENYRNTYINGIGTVGRLMQYILDPAKTTPYLCGSRGLYITNMTDMENQFYAIQSLYGKTDINTLSHIIISFSRDTLLYEDSIKLIAESISDHLYHNHQLLYAIHTNKPNLHIHFIVNPVSYRNGKPFKENTTTVKILYTLIRSAIYQLDPEINLGKCIYE